MKGICNGKGEKNILHKITSKNFRGDQAIEMAGGLLDSYKVLKEKEGSLEKA